MKVTIKSLFVAAGLLFAGMANGQTIQQGLTQLDGDQPLKAKTTFESIVKASPTAENYYYLGYALLRSGQIEAAKANFEKGITADAKNPLNTVGLGTILLSEKNLAGAKAIFDKVLLETKSKNADVLYRIAEAYTLFDHTNDPGEAVRLIDLIAEKTKKPLTADQWIVKGDAFLLKNDGGPAVSAYDQSVFTAKSAKALLKIGVVYLRGKNYQQTVNSYQQSFETDSSYAPYYKRMGEYYIIFNRYKQAASYFRKYVEKAEASPLILLETAKLMFLAKDYAGALEYIKQAEAGGARDNDVFRMNGYSLIEMGKCKEGIDNLELMVKAGVKPYFLDNVYFAKGYQCVGSDSLAVHYFEQAAPLDTNNNHYASISSIRYKQKKYAESATAALKAIDWKIAKKQALSSKDWNDVAMAQYFMTAYTPREDTLKRASLGAAADSSFAKAIAINDKWPAFQIFRARTNNYIDFTGTKWLAQPHYEKFLAAVDAQKADASSKYAPNKEQLYEAYRYLVGYHNTVTKDLTKVQEFVTKAVEIKTEDPDKLKEILNPTPAAPATPVKPAAPVKPTKK